MFYWSQGTDHAPQLKLQKREKNNAAMLAKGSKN